MCSTLENLDLFSRMYDYTMTVWTGMVQLEYIYGSAQAGYFFKITENLYCIQGMGV